MTVHVRLKNEFMEDEKCHNLMSWHRYVHVMRTASAYKEMAPDSDWGFSQNLQKTWDYRLKMEPVGSKFAVYMNMIDQSWQTIDQGPFMSVVLQISEGNCQGWWNVAICWFCTLTGSSSAEPLNFISLFILFEPCHEKTCLRGLWQFVCDKVRLQPACSAIKTS